MEEYKVKIPYEYGDEHTTKSVYIETWLGPIRGIDCQLVADISAASYPKPKEDALARLIKVATIKAPGAKVYFDILDGRLWKYLNGDVQEKDSLPRGGRKQLKLDLPIYFPEGAVIDPRNLTCLRFEVTWNGQSCLSEKQTIDGHKFPPHLILNYAYLDITLHCEKEHKGKAKILGIRCEESDWIVDSQEPIAVNLPVGDILDRTLIMVLDSNNNRSDEIIDQILVTERNKTIDDRTWDSFSRDHFSTSRGLTMLEWTQYPTIRDASKRLSGELKLVFQPKNLGTIKILTILANAPMD